MPYYIIYMYHHKSWKILPVQCTRIFKQYEHNYVLLEILHHSSLLVHFFLDQAEPEFGVHSGVVHIGWESVHHLTGSSNGGH